MDGARKPDELSRLSDLVRSPKEELEVELKGWLDISSPEGKADLAQALLALANHGGGWVLLGFDDDGTPLLPSSTNRLDYSQDLVNGIVKKFADPAFHCDVYEVQRDQVAYPVVAVPGGHRVPIRAKCSGPNEKHVRQNTYYIRRPGPESAPVSTAREWDELISKCMLAARGELLERLQHILTPRGAASSEDLADSLRSWDAACLDRFHELLSAELPEEKPSRYANGFWTFSYSLELPEPTTLEALAEAMRAAKGNETGWPVWLVGQSEHLRPYPYEGVIECWIKTGSDAAHSDFWRASPEGRLFLLRGYQEDGGESEKFKYAPGQAFERKLPIWRLGECLLHVARMSKALGVPDTKAHVAAHWTGLKGRRMGEYFTGWREGPDTAPIRQDTVQAKLSVVASEIVERLPDLVGTLSRPLYEAFSLRGMSRDVVVAELDAMRKRSR
jgi:hypothetical protein